MPGHDHRDYSRPWMTVPEAAEKMQVSDRTVRRLIKAEKLRAYRVGRQLRIDMKDLEDLQHD